MVGEITSEELTAQRNKIRNLVDSAEDRDTIRKKGNALLNSLEKRKSFKPSKNVSKSVSKRSFKTKLVSRKNYIPQTQKVGQGVVTLLGTQGYGSAKRSKGRPNGTYKYGVPIQVAKKIQTQRRAQYEMYKLQQLNALQERGLTPEQIQQFQSRRVQSNNYPQQMQVQNVPQENNTKGFSFLQRMKHRRRMMELKNLSDDDLKFRRYMAENELSPNTQNILNQIRNIQNKIPRQ